MRDFALDVLLFFGVVLVVLSAAVLAAPLVGVVAHVLWEGLTIGWGWWQEGENGA